MARLLDRVSNFVRENHLLGNASCGSNRTGLGFSQSFEPFQSVSAVRTESHNRVTLHKVSHIDVTHLLTSPSNLFF